jgi:hypothetical protein
MSSNITFVLMYRRHRLLDLVYSVLQRTSNVTHGAGSSVKKLIAA